MNKKMNLVAWDCENEEESYDKRGFSNFQAQ